MQCRCMGGGRKGRKVWRCGGVEVGIVKVMLTSEMRTQVQVADIVLGMVKVKGEGTLGFNIVFSIDSSLAHLSSFL